MNWTLTLKMDTDSGEDLLIQTSSSWLADGHQAPPLVCLATDLGYLMKMVDASGRVIGAGFITDKDREDVATSFREAIES